MIKLQTVCSSVIVFIIAGRTRVHAFTLLVKTQSRALELLSSLGFVSDAARGSLFRMSRINRKLNKARNPDYSVRSRHSVLNERPFTTFRRSYESCFAALGTRNDYIGERERKRENGRTGVERSKGRNDLTKWKNSAFNARFNDGSETTRTCQVSFSNKISSALLTGRTSLLNDSDSWTFDRRISGL